MLLLIYYPMQGRDALYDNIPGCGVDPRGLAQRIMAVTQLSWLCLVLSVNGMCLPHALNFV